MSGTSLDGLDIAYCIFSEKEKAWEHEIILAETIPYNASWKEKLSNASLLQASDLAQLNVEYGFWLGNQVKMFCEKHDIHPIFIASHGHTVFHQPEKKLSLQIGHGIAIMEACELPVINDFRTYDIILGGQGAPLVPIGDQLLFPDYACCINLGGFANISFEQAEKRLAYDICPVNIVLNKLSQTYLGVDYDKNGQIAQSGKLNIELLNNLNSLPYYQTAPPKSLGYEWVEKNILPLLRNKLPIEDLLHTFSIHVVEQLEKSISKALLCSNGQDSNILVTGGGALNRFLINSLLKKVLPNNINLNYTDNKLIAYKEALIFAFLGLLRYLKEPNVLKTVTGAKRDHCAGTIHDNIIY